MLFNQQDVKSFLPHRDPFIFIDDIESISRPENFRSLESIEGTHVIGHYFCSSDHPIFGGHFPGNPVLPGVIQVEMMAQICPFTVSHIKGLDLGKGPEMALLGITKAKFRKPIKPEMHLTIESRCIKPRGSVMTFDCSIKCEGELMSQCSITAYMPILKEKSKIKTQHYAEFEEKQSHL